MRAVCVFLLGVAIGWLMAGRREVEPRRAAGVWTDGNTTWYIPAKAEWARRLWVAEPRQRAGQAGAHSTHEQIK